MAARQNKPRALDRFKADPSLIEALNPPETREEASRKKKASDEKLRTTFIVGRDVHTRLKEIAEKEGLAPSDIVRFVLRKFLEDYGAKGPLSTEMRERIYEPTLGRKIR